MDTRELEITRTNILGRDVSVLGNPPSQKCIFITSSKGMSDEGMVSVFRSTLEITQNGYDVLIVPGLKMDETVESAVYSTMEGRMYYVVPKGLGTVPRKVLSTALVSGGGIISLEEDRETFSFEALLKAKSFASSVSICTLYADENLNYIPHYIFDALDEGREVCLLDSALRGKGARKLLTEGAPVVPSFSFALRDPRYYLVKDEKGTYCILDSRFAIMDSHGKQ